MTCSNCGKSGDNARVIDYPVRSRNQSPLCRWCRAVRTRKLRANALRRARRSAVAQEAERPVVTREGGGSRPSRGAKRESSVSPIMWCIGLILFFLALAMYSCRAMPAETAFVPSDPQMCWEYETETSIAWTDSEDSIPARYRARVRERECGSLFDYERTTIVEKPDAGEGTQAPAR